jgi:hypothetical protein
MDALQPACEAGETPLPDSLAARLDVLAPTEDALTTFLNHLATSVGGENAAGRPISDCEAFAAGLPLETPVVFAGPEAQILALVQDFHRRQRRATFLVAGCVAISCVLTIVTIAAMASFAGRASADNGDPAAKALSSIPSQGPRAAASSTMPVLAAAPDRAGKGEPLLRPAAAFVDAGPAPKGGTPQAAALPPELVLVKAGRPFALAPLLRQRQARYVLVRGLPSEARLSAGQRNPSGAWIIKDEELVQLTLSIDGVATGDFPVEIYALGASALPQGRQRLVFRVEPAVGTTPPADLAWAAALSDIVVARPAPGESGRDFGASPPRGEGFRPINWHHRASETGSTKPPSA